MFTIVALVLGIFGSGKAAEAALQDQARALVKKAVDAQGGLEKLSRSRATFSSIKGSFQEENLTFEGEVFSQSGGKLHVRLNLKNEGPRLLVMDGTKAWLKINGLTQEIGQEMQARLKVSAHVDRVSALTVLLRKKDYGLYPTGEATVKNQPALGVKVVYPEMPDVHLYFDKAAGLLLKVTYRSREPFQPRQILKETFLNGYRPVLAGAEEEQLLKGAGLGVDGPALLVYLRQNSLDLSARQKIQGLIQQLGDSTFGQRERAMAELHRWGIKAAALLQQARKSPDAEVARRVGKCLQRLHQGQEMARAAAAVRLLALRKPADAARTLLDYLPWAPDAVTSREVHHALWTLAQDGKSSHPVLLAALKDPDAHKQRAAAAALDRDGGDLSKAPGRRLFSDGLLLPHTVVLHRDGRKDMEWHTLRYEFFNRFDDSLFHRPD